MLKTSLFAREHGSTEQHESPGVLSVLSAELLRFSHGTVDGRPRGGVGIYSSPQGKGDSNIHESPGTTCGVSSARHPEQLPSQHQGAEGPDLERCSDTRDP